MPLKPKLIFVIAVLLVALSYLFSSNLNAQPEKHVQPDVVEKNIEQILGNMTLRQKVGQMVQPGIRYVQPGDFEAYGFGSVLNGGGASPGNNKYANLDDWNALADAFYEASLKKTEGSAGIPVMWGTDAVHGNNNVFGATIFPHNIGLGAANDSDLVKAIGQATALEVLASGMDWVFSPTLAVVKDDRWGRTYESYSDRSEIVEKLGRALILGLQGEGDDFLSGNHVLATAKHFIGDGGTHRGIDQGDSRLSKGALVDIHGQSYISAIDADVQTVMASFNSWNGEKIHGHKGLLTGLLRDELGFDGILLSDWNGHGQVEGCDNHSCVKAINAGIDIFMVPEDWKSLIENTIKQVESGEISEERIDEAVTRILRVKVLTGLFAKGPPSERVDNRGGIFGNKEHRALAREAVRKSLVLLKNNNNLLPLNPAQTFLIAGDGADNIGKQSGGWTLSWQGRGNSNSDFPGATSIFSGIESAVREAGGKVYMNVGGQYEAKPDVAIVVFGEEPYAEKQGDVQDLSYQQGLKRDLKLLQRLKTKGIPVVSILLTGRPLWVNAELNASDAFVVAWLPGSEGGGIADVILRKADGDVQYDFSGRLSFDWPAKELNAEHSDLPVDKYLFEYGYGLDYQNNHFLDSDLDEESAVEVDKLSYVIFKKGSSIKPWVPYVGDKSHWEKPVEGDTTHSAFGELRVQSVDRMSAKDSRKIEWTGTGEKFSQFYWHSNTFVDLTELRDRGGTLSLVLKVNKAPLSEVTLRMDCGYPCTGEISLTPLLKAARKGEWFRVNVPLSCLEKSGADLSRINTPVLITTNQAFSMTINEVSLLSGLPEDGQDLCAA